MVAGVCAAESAGRPGLGAGEIYEDLGASDRVEIVERRTDRRFGRVDLLTPLIDLRARVESAARDGREEPDQSQYPRLQDPSERERQYSAAGEATTASFRSSGSSL